MSLCALIVTMSLCPFVELEWASPEWGAEYTWNGERIPDWGFARIGAEVTLPLGWTMDLGFYHQSVPQFGDQGVNGWFARARWEGGRHE